MKNKKMQSKTKKISSGLFMSSTKKALGPVIAISLLVIVSVVAVVGFQNWYSSYSSKTFVDIETKDRSGAVSIESINGDYLYVKNSNSENETINSIKVGGIDCELNEELAPGVTSIDIGSCFNSSNSDGEQDIVIVTNNKIVEKKLFLKDLDYTTCVDVTNGLVGLWHFDENVDDSSSNSNDGNLYGDTKLLMNFNDGTATDLSFYNNDGTINGANCAVSGINGQGCSFDGSNDYIDLPITFMNGLSKFSISSWIYVSGSDLRYIMLRDRAPLSASPSDQYYIQSTTGKLVIDLANTDAGRAIAVSDELVPTGQWVHIVTTYDSSQILANQFKMYFDGIEKNLTPSGAAGGILSTSDVVTIGRDIYSFQGSIDEFVIYSKALSKSEISELYNSQKAKFIEYEDSNLGTAIKFDNGDNVDIGSVSGYGSGTGSISAWAYLESFPTGTNTRTIWSNWQDLTNREYLFLENSTGILYWVFLSNQGSTFKCQKATTDDVLNNWINVVATFNGTNCIVYENGIAGSVGPYAGAPSQNVHVIGMRNIADPVYDFNGSIDDVVIYNRSLSSEEIQQIYQGGLAKKSICDP